MSAQPGVARGEAFDCRVVVGPPATAEQEAAARARELAEELDRAARRAAKQRARGVSGDGLVS